MNARLHQAFKTLERDTEEMLAILSSLDAQRMDHQPDGGWSLNQILSHLIASERLSLQYMKKKSLGVNTLANSGWVEAIKFQILKISQRIPLRYKAPRVVVEHTLPIRGLAEIRREWSSVRDELRRFLESIEDQHIMKKIYKHPVAGRLDVIQAIGFFREHLRHHLPQVRRHL